MLRRLRSRPRPRPEDRDALATAFTIAAYASPFVLGGGLLALGTITGHRGQTSAIERAVEGNTARFSGVEVADGVYFALERVAKYDAHHVTLHPVVLTRDNTTVSSMTVRTQDGTIADFDGRLIGNYPIELHREPINIPWWLTARYDTVHLHDPWRTVIAIDTNVPDNSVDIEAVVDGVPLRVEVPVPYDYRESVLPASDIASDTGIGRTLNQ